MVERLAKLILIIPILTTIFIPGKAVGWFITGQDAHILLSGIDFNNTGGALLFNHPGKVSTDGKRLLLADSNNNRILIWNTIPEGNVEPDIVLGQDNFISNDPGTGLNRMNWPVAVSTGNDKVVVADTYNDRILIWNTFPTSNGQPADLSIELRDQSDPKGWIGWPWAVWTNGTKLIVTSTQGHPAGTVLIWNTFPTTNNQKPDLYLRGKNPDDGSDRFGTPRSIVTDGESYLIIGDHNAAGESSGQGNFVWNSFPQTDNAPYDFFLSGPVDYSILWGGGKLSDGKFVALGQRLYLWNTLPTGALDPNLTVGTIVGHHSDSVSCKADGYFFDDAASIAITSLGKLFISLRSGNRMVVYNSLPTSSTQCPDYAIGAPDIDTNTLITNYIISNPIPATNGVSLFVSSDYDKKLYVWKSLPAESGTYPDIVYDLDFPPVDNALYGSTFVLVGGTSERAVQIWTTLPTEGNQADITFYGQIGPVTFQNLRGVALDDKYLYIADEGAGKLYVWRALPDANSSPLFSLDMPGGWRLSSDGTFLTAVNIWDHKIKIYSVDLLSDLSSPIAEIPAEGSSYGLNLPEDALVADNHLFIADTGFNRVLGWKSIQEAIKGNEPDVILGQEDFESTTSAIGRDKLFWPAGLAFYRNKLWVGEYKFSNRLLEFKFQAEGPFIEITPTRHDFGHLAIGSSVSQTFTISNAGKEDLVIGTLSLSGADTTEFNIRNDNCSGQTIAPSGDCSIEVLFLPSSVGSKNANLSIPSNDPDIPVLEVLLTGTGITNNPTPDIKANGTEGPLNITSTDNLSITVELAARNGSGENADWWVAAETPFGWYYYDAYLGLWRSGLSFTYKGPLSDLTSVEILNISGLPPGTYIFYFAVDMPMNSSLDYDQLYYDRVVVNIAE
jgi:hypothetical protein